jgi:hypothetical protein
VVLTLGVEEVRMRECFIFPAVALSLLFIVSELHGVPASLPEQSPVIEPGARIYIEQLENGYHVYLAAAFHKKKVPLVIVTDKSKADFQLMAVTESEQAGWAKMLFLGSGASAEQASIMIVNLSTGNVVFGYNVNKSNSARGKQSSAEACAKHVKKKIESGH